MKTHANHSLLQDSRPRHRLLLLLLPGVCPLWLLLNPFSAGAADRNTLEFPPKPPELVLCPTIGQPEIEINSSLAGRLGGQEISDLLVPSIAHLLDQSERFVLTHAKTPRCRCVVRLSDLEIKQAGAKAKIGTAQVTQVIGSLLKRKDNGLASELSDLSTNINWSSDQAQLSVRCAVYVEIIDAESGAVLAEENGEETRTNTAKAVGLDLLGLVYGKGDAATAQDQPQESTTGSSVQYQTRLVQLAAYRAMCKFLPKLDKKLVQLTPASDSRNEVVRQSPDNAGSETHFCSACGKAVSPGDSFCTHCGVRVKK